ncbi:MAG: hypothetical protein EP338_06270 [Bacteroidetes bacterium]|nr:MAG: hypothetical protein EP338_06270 [Bacteroidota bacterium]
MNVLVNGIGNIGTTILNFLLEEKERLGIQNIYALKNSEPAPWNLPELTSFGDRGAIVLKKGELGENHANYPPLDYIFDCGANGMGLKNKEWYTSWPGVKGFSAQGSEKGFGIPFMSGVNEAAIEGVRFVQIVSCNTHSLAAILKCFAGESLKRLHKADFVIVRRSEDLGNHQRLVSANVVSRHLDQHIGTHHAIDVKDLYAVQGLTPDLQSSDVTTPSQLMHAVRFSLDLNEWPTEHLGELIRSQDFLAGTDKFDSNVIFELGRRYGFQGRIYAHAIINENNLLIDLEHKSLKGWAFIPQEGNTILSTIHAFLLQTTNQGAKQIMHDLKQKYLQKTW